MEWIKIPIQFKHVWAWVITALLTLTLTGMNCVTVAPPELSLMKTSTNHLFPTARYTPLKENPRITLHPTANLGWAYSLGWTEVSAPMFDVAGMYQVQITYNNLHFFVSFCILCMCLSYCRGSSFWIVPLLARSLAQSVCRLFLQILLCPSSISSTSVCKRLSQ